MPATQDSQSKLRTTEMEHIYIYIYPVVNTMLITRVYEGMGLLGGKKEK